MWQEFLRYVSRQRNWGDRSWFSGGWPEVAVWWLQLLAAHRTFFLARLWLTPRFKRCYLKARARVVSHVSQRVSPQVRRYCNGNK